MIRRVKHLAHCAMLGVYFGAAVTALLFGDLLFVVYAAGAFFHFDAVMAQLYSRFEEGERKRREELGRLLEEFDAVLQDEIRRGKGL